MSFSNGSIRRLTARKRQASSTAPSDRIHFIADMFRSYQASPFLYDPPFTPAQVERLDAGGRPGDPL